VVSPDAPDGPELLLEPADHPAVKPYRDALIEDGIPLAQFAVDDVGAERRHIKLGQLRSEWPSFLHLHDPARWAL